MDYSLPLMIACLTGGNEANWSTCITSPRNFKGTYVHVLLLWQPMLIDHLMSWPE